MTAISSRYVRLRPHFGDHFSANALVEHHVVVTLLILGLNGPSPPARLEPIGIRDMDSTPPAITTSV